MLLNNFISYLPTFLPELSRAFCSVVRYASTTELVIKSQSIFKTNSKFDSDNGRCHGTDRRCYSSSYRVENKPTTNLVHLGSSLSSDEKNEILKNMLVIESFLSEDEEKSLLSEIEPYMKRLRYEFNHWDNAIHAYRETERLKWTEENTKIINRIRDLAFLPGSPQLHHVHILDLAEEGYIKPHIDSVRFCGNTIAGLSLLTDSVMRLVRDNDKSKSADVLLKQRSLYIMRDAVRYDYTHEILPNNESFFKQNKIEKRRRISVICRNEPSPSKSS